MKRAILIVMDSVGIGEMPDAEKFGDKGSSTLINIKKHVPSMELKNLCRLGLSKNRCTQCLFAWLTGKYIGLLRKNDRGIKRKKTPQRDTGK